MNRGRELLGFVDTPHVGWRDDVVVFMGPRLSGYSGLDVEHLSRVELESAAAWSPTWTSSAKRPPASRMRGSCSPRRRSAYG